MSLTSSPSRGLARPVGDLLDRGLELVPDAPAGLHRLDDQRGRAVLAEDRLLRLQDQFGTVLVELRAGLVDALPVGFGEAALALEHDHGRCELPARELLDGLERLHGLRVAGEERRGLVLLDAFELARLAGETDEEHEGEEEDDVFGAPAGRERQHVNRLYGARPPFGFS